MLQTFNLSPIKDKITNHLALSLIFINSLLFLEKIKSLKSVNNSSLISSFRWVALAEGISYLFLLLVAMPLKYLAQIPEAVLWTGWVHGLLFMLYVLGALLIKKPANLTWIQLGLVLLGSILPFGPFVVDANILKGKG
jgi:integral membrane protein